MTTGEALAYPEVRASIAGTALFAVAAAIGVAAPSASAIATIVSFVLFGIGCVVFLWAFARAINRSREESVSVFGVYFLIGSAPRSVQVLMHLATVAQLAIAITAASLRPFTVAAFGILVPMFGLGMSGLWGARHGVFVASVKRATRSTGSAITETTGERVQETDDA